MSCIQDVIAEASTFNDIDDGAPERPHNSVPSMEPSLTLDFNNPCVSASDWTLAIMNDTHQSDAHTTSNTSHSGMHNDITCENRTVPQGRLRTRNPKDTQPTTIAARKRRRVQSTKKNDAQDCWTGPTRPVVFAVSRTQSNMTRSMQSSVLQYSIDDLVKGCQMDPTSLPPTVSTSHSQIDSYTSVQHRYMHLSLIQPETISSTATSQRNTTNYCVLQNS
jgi:hypothetical protein